MREDNEFYTRLFLQKEGTVKEYEQYGLKVEGDQWQPEGTGDIIEKAVSRVDQAALKATQTWLAHFTAILQELGCDRQQLLQYLCQLHPDLATFANCPWDKLVEHGDRLTCASGTSRSEVVWRSVDDWVEVGILHHGAQVVASASPFFVDGYWLLQVKEPKGVVDLRRFRIVDT